MPRVAYADAALTVWQGTDALQFIDGLSTNKVVDLAQGEICRTVFTTSQAKIIDIVTVFHMGEFLAVLSHKSKLENLLLHVTPRILNQDVSISDVTSRNVFGIEYGRQNENIGIFQSIDGITYGHITSSLSFLVASINVKCDFDEVEKAFHQWRIENLVPWNGYELTEKNHPLASGVNELVHPQKGCYIGQEVLARMISRGRQGKMLVRIKNDDVEEKFITTRGETTSLAIVRVRNQ
tara:strand:+ start:11161 stop:11871 length:711 start_codon:yes stop_codon:yes gene_type:complete